MVHLGYDTGEYTAPTGTAVQTGVNITGGVQALGSTGISITFAGTTGHTSGDYWFVDKKNYLSGDFRFDNASMPHVTKLCLMMYREMVMMFRH